MLQEKQGWNETYEIELGMQVLYMLGDITAGPAFRFTQWLESVRKRSAQYRSSGFPRRPSRLQSMPFGCVSSFYSFILFISLCYYPFAALLKLYSYLNVIILGII